MTEASPQLGCFRLVVEYIPYDNMTISQLEEQNKIIENDINKINMNRGGNSVSSTLAKKIRKNELRKKKKLIEEKINLKRI